MKIKTIILLILCLAPSFSLLASGTSETQALTIRIVTLKGPTGLGMLSLLEAKSLRLPDGSSIPLAIELVASPDILDARLIGKQVDAVTIPVNQAARLYNKGVDLKLAAVNVWGVLYCLSTDSSVKGWADLKGRKILFSGKGSATDITFRELATRNGLNPETELNIDYSFSHIEVMQLAIAGKSDLVLLPEPFVTRVLQKQATMKIVLDLQAEWNKIFTPLEQAQGGLVLSGEFIRSYPIAAAALVKAYGDSCRAVLSDPTAPGRIAKQDLGLDEASARESLPRLNLRFELAKEARTAVDAFLAILFKAQPASVGDRLPDSGFYWLP